MYSCIFFSWLTKTSRCARWLSTTTKSYYGHVCGASSLLHINTVAAGLARQKLGALCSQFGPPSICILPTSSPSGRPPQMPQMPDALCNSIGPTHPPPRFAFYPHYTHSLPPADGLHKGRPGLVRGDPPYRVGRTSHPGTVGPGKRHPKRFVGVSVVRRNAPYFSVFVVVIAKLAGFECVLVRVGACSPRVPSGRF